MTRNLRSLAVYAAVALSIVGHANNAVAQSFPTRTITMIVPFGAGGGTDIIARAVSEDLSRALKQPIVVEPRPGANGAIGSALAARAAPDGARDAPADHGGRGGGAGIGAVGARAGAAASGSR